MIRSDRGVGPEPGPDAIRDHSGSNLQLLVILSADPLAAPPQDLRDIEVLETIKDGEVVFRA